MKRMTIIYTRVSTNEQAEEGYSLEGQKAQLKRKLKAKGIEKYKLYVDDGFSAYKRNVVRPAFEEVKELIIQNKVERLIFIAIDRVARRQKVYMNFIELCQKHNVEISSLTEDLKFDPFGIFMQSVKAGMSEFYSADISEKTKNGYVGMLESKLYPFGGPTPFGISKREDKSIYYNEDSKIVKEIFKLNKQGYSFSKIGKIIQEKYNLKFNKGKIEDTVKKSLYQGFIIYKGRKYNIIEPLINQNHLLEVETINGETNLLTLKKRINFKHSYLLDGKITYLDLNNKLYSQTTRKRLKTTGKIKEYKYYFSTDKKVKLNEDYLLKVINKNMKIYSSEKVQKQNNKFKNLNKLYALGEITKEEYDSIKKDLKNTFDKKVNLQEIEKNISVNSKYDIYIDFNSKVIKFNYKEEINKI